MAKEQKELGMEGPGVAPVKIKPIENAAEAYREVRDRRMALTEEEGKSKEKLRALCEKHGIKLYTYESEDTDDEGNPIQFDVVVDDEPTIKVKKHKAAKVQTDDADEAEESDD